MDTLSDTITRIRNAYLAGKQSVTMPYSTLSESVVKLLAKNEYVSSVDMTSKKTKRGGVVKELAVVLAYRDQLPVLTHITRISKPGRRMTVGAHQVPKVLDGYGIAIISTSQGLMTDMEAKKKHIGGEILLTVY